MGPDVSANVHQRLYISQSSKTHGQQHYLKNPFFSSAEAMLLAALDASSISVFAFSQSSPPTLGNPACERQPILDKVHSLTSPSIADIRPDNELALSCTASGYWLSSTERRTGKSTLPIGRTDFGFPGLKSGLI